MYHVIGLRNALRAWDRMKVEKVVQKENKNECVTVCERRKQRESGGQTALRSGDTVWQHGFTVSHYSKALFSF